MSGNEIRFDKFLQFLVVFFKIKKKQILIDNIFYFFVDQLKFLGTVIGRCNIPVEIVLIKNIVNFVIGDKGNFFAVESTQHGRWQIFVKSTGFPNGKNQLNDRFINIGRVFLGFCPKQ